MLGTGSQQVDDVQMVADVGQDLELSHQCFVLAGRGPLCVRSEEESRRPDNGALSAGGGIPAPRFVTVQLVVSLTSPHSAEGPSLQTVFITPTLPSQHPFDYSKAQHGGGVSHRVSSHWT